MLAKTLKWPVITLLLAGGFHFVVEAAFSDFQTVLSPPVVAPVLTGWGLWVGYKGAQNGGTLVNAMLAGAILGMLPVILDVVGFGIVFGRGIHQSLLGGVLGFTIIFWGALLGGGISLSK